MVDDATRKKVRIKLVMSDPALTEAIIGGGAFGGSYSLLVAQNMFDRHHEPAIEDAKRLVEIEEVAQRSWLVRLPIVNVSVAETGRAVLELYTSRIINDAGNTQEALMYLDHMTEVQLAIDQAD